MQPTKPTPESKAEPRVWKIGDVAWLDTQNLFSDREPVRILEIYHNGVARLTTATGAKRSAHVKRLSTDADMDRLNQQAEDKRTIEIEDEERRRGQL